jgi:hypothetical protein
MRRMKPLALLVLTLIVTPLHAEGETASTSAVVTDLRLKTDPV